mmetsp:Transcript_51412/g.80362  ORF Transcript_51412/g.80362 Transcript_51412/m.80362 type:complete len:339 (-) Transcript_51412:68-1084(-)
MLTMIVMAPWALVSFFLLSAIGLQGTAAEPVSLDAVVDLTNEDAISFDDKVQDGNHTPWFVKFYAPWCGHCKAMEPMWQQLAKKLKGKVRVAKVDCTVAKHLASDFDVDGFPTLKLISKAKVYEYNGDRDINLMVDWAKKGHKNQEDFTLMPREKTWIQKFWSRLEDYLVTYGLPIILVVVVLACIYVAFFAPESAEEKARLEAHLADLRQAQENQRRWAEIENNVIYVKLTAAENKVIAKHKGDVLETYTCSPELKLRQIRAEMQERYPHPSIIRMISSGGIAYDKKFDEIVLGSDEDFEKIPLESAIPKSVKVPVGEDKKATSKAAPNAEDVKKDK